MKTTLVGYTGFVGGNLAASHRFDNCYNSSNISESFGADNGYVVYSGMPAEKFLANTNADADLQKAKTAMENIRKMRPQRLVLISTVDVYPHPHGVYEDMPIQNQDATPYGENRLALERWVQNEYPTALVLRLPGLFGKGLKKNFIFDMLTLTPSMLTADKYEELAKKEPLVKTAYKQDSAGFYRLLLQDASGATQLKTFFAKNDFNSLCFTDSRSAFQFYNLKNLWADIQRCEKAGLTLVNLATQPVGAGALYQSLYGCEFENHTPKGPAFYDMRTRFGRELGGLDDYVADRAEVLAGIAKFAAEFAAV